MLLDLASNRVPEGARAGFASTPDGVRLRYAYWPRRPGARRGTVCIAQGRAEFIEKYFETVEDFRARGFAVATFDWRGQGGSDRLIGDRGLGYVERFSDYVTDLASIHRAVLLPDCPPPFYLVGHSMGGLVGLLGALSDRLMFDRLFLSAPMIGLDRPRGGPGGWAGLAEALCFFGLGTLPVGRRADRTPDPSRFKDNPLTSDAARYARMVEALAARPGLATGAPTLRWAGAAMRAMAEAERDDFPQRLRVPVLMLAAARDTVVSSAAIEQLGLRLRTGRHTLVPGARHELFMENDAVRAQVLAAFDAFITEQSA